MLKERGALKMDTFGIVLLAAGKGKRLSLAKPKPLAALMGRKLIDFSLGPLQNFLQDRSGRLTVVLGHRREQVENHIRAEHSPSIRIVYQEQLLGTGDAVKSYFQNCNDAKELKYTIIVCSDTPLLEEKIFSTLLEYLEKKNLLGVVATFHTDNPTGYGRIVREEQNFRIIEEADCSKKMRAITEVNSGIYIVETDYLLSRLEKIHRNDITQEFYLTDIACDNSRFEALVFGEPERFAGVNTLEQLESAEAVLRKRKIQNLRAAGVCFLDSRHVYVEDQVAVAPGTRIEPHVHLKGKTTIGKNCVLENGSIITDSIIQNDVVIKSYSYIEGACIGERCQVGPFAHLRRGSDIACESKIGNFVEIKNSQIGEKVGISHLSYVGDAEIGDMTNIGCGFVTCNYDGEKKHKTKIGKNNFIGSDSQMIAPVSTGDSCYIASGSTINKDMPAGSFASSRSRQETKPGWAERFFKGKWAGRKRGH